MEIARAMCHNGGVNVPAARKLAERPAALKCYYSSGLRDWMRIGPQVASLFLSYSAHNTGPRTKCRASLKILLSAFFMGNISVKSQRKVRCANFPLIEPVWNARFLRNYLMRLHFELSPNVQPVSFDYQHFLTGVFHKWLGDNALHDGLSLYSLSWLSGGKRQGDGIAFPNGASWFISAHDSELLHRICISAVDEPSVCCGMLVTRIRILLEPEVREKHVFKVASPVLARSKEVEGKVRHFIYSDAEADEVLTQTLRHKLDKAGLNGIALDTNVKFDRSYRSAQTKLVKINGVANRASICPVIVEGPPEAVQFAWNVGVGHLTGSGFGALV